MKLLIKIIITGFLFVPVICNAQGEKNSILLSGIVVDGDSSFGVPGVHIYIPKAGGTTSNHIGFFQIPTQIGDTVVIRALGYKLQQLVVPDRDDLGFSVIIDLKTDTTMLPLIEVYPYPTKELFKEAFLALQLPSQDIENMEKNLNQESLTWMSQNMAMDGSINHRFYMNQYISSSTGNSFAPSFSILNPFAWARFIRSIKKGDLKKKEEPDNDN